MTWRYPDKPTTAAPEFLATLRNGEWIVQAKMDGWRCLMHKQHDDSLVFTSRHRQPIPVDPKLRDQAQAAAISLAPGAIVDCEWMGRRADAPEQLVCFDLLHDGATWLGALGCMDRFARMHEAMSFNVTARPLIVPVCWDNGGYAEFFEESRGDSTWEGVVVKHKDSRYIGSVRQCVDNPRWFKIRYRGGADGQAAVG